MSNRETARSDEGMRAGPASVPGGRSRGRLRGMKPRHLLLAVPFFLLAGCTGSTAPDTPPATDTALATTNSGQNTTPGSTAVSSELPDWDSNGPVDEAAADARDAVFKDLDALRQNGENALRNNPELTDSAVRDDVLKNSSIGSAVEADGATGIRVTATKGEISCTGILSFTSGTGTWNSIECS